MNESTLKMLAANALKSIARNEQIKTYVQESQELYPLLFRAAQRFVAGETREAAISQALELMSKGYLVSLEYIGENTRTEGDCIAAKDEFVCLIRAAAEHGVESTVSLDLSHIGMTVDDELAYRNLTELAKEASPYGLTIMISMEESAKTDRILGLYKRVAELYSNVGITLQAHLHRTLRDFAEIEPYLGRIRIVKGAYQEAPDLAVPRSEELDARYLRLVEMAVRAGRPVSIASHDQEIIEKLRQRGYLHQPNVEVEMLYGIRPDFLKRLKDDGCRTKVYLTYGREWYLYLCHRLAEYPPNIYVAIADMTGTGAYRKGSY